MFKLSRKTQFLALSALCIALIGLTVFIVFYGNDKTPAAPDNAAPESAAVSAPANPAASGASDADAAPETFYYVEAASYLGKTGGYDFEGPCFMNGDNQLFLMAYKDTEIEPGILESTAYLLTTGDLENTAEYGGIQGRYLYRFTSEYEYEALEGKWIHGFTFDENNNLYVVYVDMNGDYTLTVYDGQFNIIKADIPWSDDDPGEYAAMRYYGGNIYVLERGRDFIRVYSADGELREAALDYPRIACMDITSDGFLYTAHGDARGNSVRFISKDDLNTGKNVYDIEFTYEGELDNAGNEKMCYNPYDGCVYIAGYESIQRYDAEKGIREDVIVYGTDTSFFVGPPQAGDYILRDLVCDGEGNLYLIGSGRESDGIHKFVRMPGARPAVDEGAIKTVVLTACYKDPMVDAFLYEGIKRYKALNPGIRIEYDAMYDSFREFNDNYDDAVARLLTRVLSNDMLGDIVVITDAVQQALATDVFIDLWDRVRGDESYPDLNLNAFNGVISGGLRPDGKLTGLPVGVRYDFMLYNKALGDELGVAPDFDTFSWGDAIDLALELDLKSRGAYVYGGRWEMDNILFEVVRRNLPDLMDREKKVVNLKQDWFITLLEKLKAVEALGMTRITHIDGGAFPDCLFAGGGSTTKNLIFTWQRATGYFGAGEGYGDDFVVIPMLAGERNRNATATQAYMYSISANSKLQDEAWEFLSFLISENMQSRWDLNGIPVNRKAIERELTSMLLEGSGYGLFDRYSAVAEQLRGLFDRIDVLSESKYNWYLVDALMDYVYGDSSLDAALDKAEYDIWLMLNE